MADTTIRDLSLPPQLSPRDEERKAVDRRIQEIQDYSNSPMSLLQKALCVVPVVGILLVGLGKLYSYVARKIAVQDLKNYVFSRNLQDKETVNKAVCYLREHGILPQSQNASLTESFKRFEQLEKHLPEILKQMPETKRAALLFLQEHLADNEEISFASVRTVLQDYFQNLTRADVYHRKCLEEALKDLKVPQANKEIVLRHLARQPILSLQNLLLYSEETIRAKIQSSLHVYHKALLLQAVENTTSLKRHQEIQKKPWHLDPFKQDLVTGFLAQQKELSLQEILSLPKEVIRQRTRKGIEQFLDHVRVILRSTPALSPGETDAQRSAIIQEFLSQEDLTCRSLTKEEKSSLATFFLNLCHSPLTKEENSSLAAFFLSLCPLKDEEIESFLRNPRILAQAISKIPLEKPVKDLISSISDFPEFLKIYKKFRGGNTATHPGSHLGQIFIQEIARLQFFHETSYGEEIQTEEVFPIAMHVSSLERSPTNLALFVLLYKYDKKLFDRKAADIGEHIKSNPGNLIDLEDIKQSLTQKLGFTGREKEFEETVEKAAEEHFKTKPEERAPLLDELEATLRSQFLKSPTPYSPQDLLL